VPTVDGRWQLATDEDDVALLVVEHRAGDEGQCRAGKVTYVENGDSTEYGDEVCGGLPVWVLLKELMNDRPTGYSFDSLQYTVRLQEKGDLMVIISPPDEMLAFLEIALPELGSACDPGDRDFKWSPFERLPAEEEQAEEGAPGE